MKKVTASSVSAFAKGFERGFNSPAHFLVGDYNKPDYMNRRSKSESGTQVRMTLKVRVSNGQKTSASKKI